MQSRQVMTQRGFDAIPADDVSGVRCNHGRQRCNEGSMQSWPMTHGFDAAMDDTYRAYGSDDTRANRVYRSRGSV